jgi:predicted phosphodiesterase
MANSAKRSLYFLGDVHGNWRYLEWVLSSSFKSFVDSDIIQVGDFGVGFRTLEQEMTALYEINDTLYAINAMLYVIRGNHDDPTYFNTNKLEFSNIKFLKDYTVLNCSGKNILCVGGAVSIDRVYRHNNNMHHFKGEEFNLNLDLLPNSTEKNIDIIVTHTSPTFCYPTGFNNLVYSFAANDPTLLDDLNKERKLLDELFNKIQELGHNVTNHFYGHFHTSHIDTINKIQHRLLTINELYLCRF